MIFGSHPLSFFTRLVHVASMAFLFGGSLLLWRLSRQPKETESRERGRLLLYAAEKYERFSWLALGLIVLTGIGNLGAFGAGLPGKESFWGTKLTVKLSLVIVFLLLSLLRTLQVAGQRMTAEEPNSFPVTKSFRVLYGGTALYLLLILLFALSLAHA